VLGDEPVLNLDVFTPKRPEYAPWRPIQEARAQRRALIQCSRKLGIIFPTCWTTRAGQKPQSTVCARRCTPRANKMALKKFVKN
jgi:hypothetical protein